jgi:hypothetical protein
MVWVESCVGADAMAHTLGKYLALHKLIVTIAFIGMDYQSNGGKR